MFSYLLNIKYRVKVSRIVENQFKKKISFINYAKIIIAAGSLNFLKFFQEKIISYSLMTNIAHSKIGDINFFTHILFGNALQLTGYFITNESLRSNIPALHFCLSIFNS